MALVSFQFSVPVARHSDVRQPHFALCLAYMAHGFRHEMSDGVVFATVDGATSVSEAEARAAAVTKWGARTGWVPLAGADMRIVGATTPLTSSGGVSWACEPVGTRALIVLD
jgi:hypothetical protein